MIGPVLAWSGYQEGAVVQSPTALTAIRLMIALAPTVLLIVACVVAWFYPLTRERHAEISRELAQRRRERGQAEADVTELVAGG
jgi:GPH family glycoside/pentoside/hexuronide:cation symporter